jgi:diaminopimelate epimerase
MSIAFVKYQGTGNDFIIIDARKNIPSGMDVAQMCHRKYGIGADGLMLLTQENGYDFGMIYYNSDGNLSTMCGNGGRCIAHFAHSLGIGEGNRLSFLAVDGPHEATINGDSVSLGMIDVKDWEVRNGHTVVLNTGSPHYIRFMDQQPSTVDLIPFAQSIRYGNEFATAGINVNIVQMLEMNQLCMRTYERGVEDETLSCGTGVTAAAIAHAILHRAGGSVSVSTPGGTLRVSFAFAENSFTKVILEGPAIRVFDGTL